jgi:hypothetical protein
MYLPSLLPPSSLVLFGALLSLVFVQITGKKMHSTLWYLQHSPA